MKIMYDYQIFTMQNYGGISRYFCELIVELERLGELQLINSLMISNNRYITDVNLFAHRQLLSGYEFSGKRRICSIINKTYTINQLKKTDYDLFHPTYYDPYFLNYIGDTPFVITIYDMIHEKFTENFKVNDETSTHKKLLAEKAAKIIAISENTKQDIIDIFGVSEEKVDVIHLGNSLFSQEIGRTRIDIPEKFILFVGTRGGYKNFNKFIKSCKKLLIDDGSLQVICAGGGKFSAEERSLFQELQIDDRVKHYSPDDDELCHLYNKAKLFVFPSLYEGFGIPLLEAMSCECPLVCSNTSSFKEVAGNAAIYFNPYSEDAMRVAISTVLDNCELQSDLRKKARERVKQFSWSSTAAKTKDLYRQVIA